MPATELVHAGLNEPAVTLPKDCIGLTFFVNAVEYTDRIFILRDFKAKQTSVSLHKGNPAYPVLCLDHPWGWEWCLVAHFGCGGPSANGTWGDIRTGSQSHWPLEGLQAGEEAKIEGEGQEAPARPSRYPAVTSSATLFKRVCRFLTQPMKKDERRTD